MSVPFEVVERENEMKSTRITALLLAAALALVTLGYNLGTQLESAVSSYMTTATAHAVSTIGE